MKRKIKKWIYALSGISLLSLSILVLCAFLGLLIFNKFRGFLRPSDLNFCYLVAAFPALVIVFYYSWPIDGSKRSWKFWSGNWYRLLTAVILVFVGVNLVEFLNSVLDTSQPKIRTVVIKDKFMGGGAGVRGYIHHFYLADFEDWKNPSKTCEVGISDEMDAKLNVGDPMNLKVHNGFFGFEWTGLPEFVDGK